METLEWNQKQKELFKLYFKNHEGITVAEIMNNMNMQDFFGMPMMQGFMMDDPVPKSQKIKKKKPKEEKKKGRGKENDYRKNTPPSVAITYRSIPTGHRRLSVFCSEIGLPKFDKNNARPSLQNKWSQNPSKKYQKNENC